MQVVDKTECGACGGTMEETEDEKVLICHSCNLVRMPWWYLIPNIESEFDDAKQ